ncbi:helix-turn-helix domain-containing protein [Streptomyces bauhiniae]|uniref:helix-turn-helix domain-containing protein n=1 Tax=Streptomyces bauhiniae TaxID=2340725 RepID=UPI003653B4F2
MELFHAVAWSLMGREESFKPDVLRQLRELGGVSRRALADAVGVTQRTVAYWESGQRKPEARQLHALLSFFKVDAHYVTNRPRGSVTLRDLRREAGFSNADEAAQAVSGRKVMRGISFDSAKLLRLERGLPVRGTVCSTPEHAGHLAKALALVYKVPEHVVVDAWRRTRPDESAPVLPRPGPRAGRSTLIETWNGLNDRQRIYLEACFLQDVEEERAERARYARTGQRRPAAEWRKMTLALYVPPEITGHSRLQERLRDRGVHDPGTGPSIAALDRRGLIAVHHDTVTIPGAGLIKRTQVEMTKRGRAVARAGLGVSRSRSAPAPMMSVWLWRTLVRVAFASQDGGDYDLVGRARLHLTVKTGPGQEAPSRGYLEHRLPDGATWGRHAWYPSASGWRHIADYLSQYRELYPTVPTDGLEDLIPPPYRTPTVSGGP